MTSIESRGVIGIGYQGREITDFVSDLVDDGVTRLIDVRLTPISRKRGFSKSALREALTGAGIAYDHRRELGNPKDNRAGFSGTETQLADAKAAYARLITNDAANQSLEELSECARNERVAVLCFEADQHHCHRDVVLTEILRRSPDRI